MPQAIYLDEKLSEAVQKAAEADKTSVNAWVAEAVVSKLKSAVESSGWPEAVRNLAGAWSDFPERETLDKLPPDMPRESL
jgi:hypothetical protein